MGLGKACEVAAAELAAEAAGTHPNHVRILRDRLEAELLAALGELYVNGHPSARLPGTLNVSFPFIEGDSLVASLKEICVSSTSACMSASGEISYVLSAMGKKPELIQASIRFGLGRFTTEEEIVYTITKVTETVKQLQAHSPLFQIHQANAQISGGAGETSKKKVEIHHDHTY